MARALQVGINLTFEYNKQNAFINKVKQCSIWAGTLSGSGRQFIDGSQYNADANGYPTDFNGTGSYAGQTFSQMDINPMRGVTTPFFKSGDWVFLWSGTADATHFALKDLFSGGSAYPIVSSSYSAGSGRIVFTISTPDTTGPYIILTGIDGSNTVTDMALVHSDYESLHNAGEIVDPDWFSLFGIFDAYRFKDWTRTDSNVSTTYPHPDPAYIFWGETTPIEVMVYFCNKANAHGWFNTQPLCYNAGVVEQATRVLNGNTDNNGRVWSGLNSNLNCYVEHFNEYWNAYGYPAAAGQVARGALLFPGYSSDASRQNAYFFLRTVQCENIWKDVWGGSSRVIRVQGSQDGADGSYQQDSLPQGGPDQAGGGYTFTANCSISGTTLTVVSGLSGTIVDEATYGAGQLVYGTNVLPQTYIVSGSGSTWTVSKSHSATGTQAMTGAYWEIGTTNGSLTDVAGQASYASSLIDIFTPSTVDDIFNNMMDLGLSFTGYISGTTLTVTDNPSSNRRLYTGIEITAGALAGTTIVSQLTKNDSKWCLKGTYEVSISQTAYSAGTPGSFTILYGGMHDVVGQVQQGNLAHLNTYGKTNAIVNYEGGYGDVSVDSGIQALILAAKSDSRMYDMYITMLNLLEGMGVPLFMQLDDCQGGDYVAGAYSATPNILIGYGDYRAQQYNALYDFIRSGQATMPFLSGSLSFRLHS